MQHLNPLKQVLLDEYGSFADRRIKNIERGTIFIADDRGPADYDARKQLFLWFCMIFAEASDPELVKVSVRGGVPRGAAVTAWAKQHGVDQPDGSLVFDVMPGDVKKLGELAKAFRSIVRPGAPHYREAAYKYVCPRTAASLERLQETLAKHWGI